MTQFSLPDVVFILVALLTVGSAAYAVFSRNIVRSVFSLLATFLGVAILYGMLSADYVAVVQLMVYVGGILVLLLFAVMLTSQIETAMTSNRTGGWMSGGVISLGLLLMLLAVAWRGPWARAPEGDFQASTATIGFALLGPYWLPFLLAGLLLTIVVMGAVTLARWPRAGR